MFHAYGKTESTDRIGIIRALFDLPDLHSYPFVEVPLNIHLFHVDIAPKGSDSRWQRFIFDSLRNIFGSSSANHISIFRIYVQSKRESNADYQIRRIVEISEACTVVGSRFYILTCSDGSTVVDSLNCVDEEEITGVSNVWQAPGIDK